VGLTAVAAPRGLWSRRGGLAVLALGLVLSMGPSLVHYATTPGDYFTERYRDVLLVGNANNWKQAAKEHNLPESDHTAIFLVQLQRAGLAAWRYRDMWLHFGMDRPMLDPIAGVLLILGLGYALRHLVRPAVVLVVAWVVSYVLAGALTTDPPAYQRLVGLALPVGLLGGLALERTLAWVSAAPRWQTPSLVLGLAVVAASGALNWHEYLAWGSDPRNASEGMRIARFLQAQPPEYPILLLDPSWDWGDADFPFLLPGRRGVTVAPQQLGREDVPWPAAPAIFVLSPGNEVLLAELRRRYPAGRLLEDPSEPRPAAFLAYVVGAGGR